MVSIHCPPGYEPGLREVLVMILMKESNGQILTRFRCATQLFCELLRIHGFR